MNARTILGLLGTSTIAAALIAGCGSNVATGGSGGTGGNDTTTGTGASSSTTGTGGAGPACTDFDPPKPTPAPVIVRLVNTTANNVYLGDTMTGCSANIGFKLEDANMAELKVARDACELTCSELQQQGCACAADCAAPVVTLIKPGGHYDIGWPGTIFEPEAMPAKCYQDPSCAIGDCIVEKLPPTGPLTMTSSAYTMALGCAGSGCNDCTPGPSGSCIVFGASTVGGTEIPAKVTWMGEGMVEIDFK